MSKTAALLMLTLALVACDGDAPGTATDSASEPGPQPASDSDSESESESDPDPDPDSLPLAERIQGRWLMDLNTVPDGALTPELIEAKRAGGQGLVPKIITVTDTRFRLEPKGSGPGQRDEWHYEIVKEYDGVLTLRRTDGPQAGQEVEVRFQDGLMQLGTAGGKIPLQRMQ
ncbi:MAG: hypothetical protein PVI30_16555 [Myxococcales bacterium]|jgi:hypothetical protein